MTEMFVKFMDEDPLGINSKSRSFSESGLVVRG